MTLLSFNAARGFVGGAACYRARDVRRHQVSMPHAALWVVQLLLATMTITYSMFQCRTRLCGWCNLKETFDIRRKTGFQCRTRLCGWCNSVIIESPYALSEFQCRTRLCGWCNARFLSVLSPISAVSMPHAALWVVQQKQTLSKRAHEIVSMPHAALWVVQLRRSQSFSP